MVVYEKLNTPLDIIFQKFLREIEKDETFFEYINLPLSQAKELAEKRIKDLFKDATIELASICESDIDFTAYNIDKEEYNFELINSEIRLISKVMYKIFMSKDLSTLHAFALNFMPSELNVFSPANERNSYLNLIKKIESDVNEAIDKYESIDRTTGKRKFISYTNYFEEE